MPAACSAAIFALCSAKRFFRSEGDSNLGFFAAAPPAPPGPGFPVAARRSASACANWPIIRWLWAVTTSSGMPSMPNISTSRPERFGKAFSIAPRDSLWTWVMCTDRPPAVLSLLPHRSHLKCLAFWWLIRILRSSKSRSQ